MADLWLFCLSAAGLRCRSVPVCEDAVVGKADGRFAKP